MLGGIFKKAAMRSAMRFDIDPPEDSLCGALISTNEGLCQLFTVNSRPCYLHRQGIFYARGQEIKIIMRGAERLGMPVTFRDARRLKFLLLIYLKLRLILRFTPTRRAIRGMDV